MVGGLCCILCYGQVLYFLVDGSLVGLCRGGGLSSGLEESVAGLGDDSGDHAVFSVSMGAVSGDAVKVRKYFVCKMSNERSRQMGSGAFLPFQSYKHFLF